jgi:GLPGLI family protein
MTKVILAMLFSAICQISEGQNYMVKYQAISSGGNIQTLLQISDSISTFHAIQDGVTKIPEGHFFFINTNRSLLYQTESFKNIIFYVADSLYPMKWQLLPDTMLILRKKCLAATTVFRGRKYLAYYAPAIPITGGPWKFGGLPGLILSLSAEDNYVKYQAVELVENYSGEIKVPDVSKIKFLNWNEFVIKYKESFEKLKKQVRSDGTMPPGSTLTLKMDRTEIIYPELSTGKGITF